MQVRKQQLELDMEKQTGFQIGKGVRQGCMLLLCLFNFYAEYIMWNAKLYESKAEIKIAKRNINNLRCTDDSTLMVLNLLMRVKEEGKKAVLKLNIQKLKFIASSPITSWKIDEETMETVTDFISLCSKITVDGDCSHKLKDACSLEGKLWPI